VQKHTAALFAKLGAANRAEAAAIAYETHLLKA
jgi:DNA-binding NarL/FixJ family response regulator